MMDFRDSGVVQAVRAFVEELSASRALSRQPGVTLWVSPAAIDAGGSGGVPPFHMSGRPQDVVKAAAEKIGAAPGMAAALEFGPGLTVADSLVLPAEAEDVLRAIVRNKVESFAPWPLSHSVVGHRVREIPGDAAHVAVDAVVVSRNLLDDLAAQLGQSGITVVSAAARLEDGAVVPLDFGGQEERAGALRRAVWLGAGLAALAACVMGVGLFLDWQSYSEAAQYRQETERLMASLQGSAGDGGPPLVNAANRLYAERLRRPPAIAVLNELSRLLPQTVWLSALTLDNEKLELKGQGSDIPALIKLLEGSGTFRDVNFSAATQLNEELNSDAFAIEAVLEQAPAKAAP